MLMLTEVSSRAAIPDTDATDEDMLVMLEAICLDESSRGTATSSSHVITTWGPPSKFDVVASSSSASTVGEGGEC